MTNDNAETMFYFKALEGFPNVSLVDKGIDTVTKEDVIDAFWRSPEDQKPICVIYTGGSVGLIRKDASNPNSPFEQATLEQLVAALYKYNIPRFRHNVHFFTLENVINSANISKSDWVQIASAIELLYDYYNGFVILHGSHTIAYTASALSFMFKNLGKPIVLTGSEFPLDNHSDHEAQANILGALSFVDACPTVLDIREVCVFYHGHLFRGNRTTKNIAINKEHAFCSPNFPEIGTHHGSKPSVISGYRTPKSDETFKVRVNFSEHTRVIEWLIAPEMDVKSLELLITNSHCDAVILRTYGLGEIPDSSGELIRILTDYINSNGIIISIPQARIGTETTELIDIANNYAQIYDMGIIVGGNMVFEAAYCKLFYLLGKYSGYSISEKINFVKENMTINLRGEMNYDMYRAIIAENATLHRNEIQAVGKITFPTKHLDNSVYVALRITGILLLDHNKNTTEEVRLHLKLFYDSKILLLEFEQSFGLSFFDKPVTFTLPVNKTQADYLLNCKDNQDASLWANQDLKFDTLSLVCFCENI